MDKNTGEKINKMCVAVTGATGLIGKCIVDILCDTGACPIALVRNVSKAEKIFGDDVTCVHWDFNNPDSGDWKHFLTKADAVIHLAGTPLFKQRWNPEFKRKIKQSRVLGTRQLVNAIILSEKKPGVFISASALGYYGTNPDMVADENDKPADDFLSDICVNWEGEAEKLYDCGVRCVQMRIGIVLSTKSGALKELLLPFKLGLGGVMGNPHPFINWIHLEDVARMFVMALCNDNMNGPYNAAGPAPVTNAEFGKSIARALSRPAFMRFPPPILKAIIGEAAGYASGGPRAKTDKIQDTGFKFFFTSLDKALDNLLR